MFRKFASLIVAAATLVFAPTLTSAAMAQSREPNVQSAPPPRVSPDEARRRGGQAGGGRPIDTRPRSDGDYSVLVERGGSVREVVVDGQTGQTRSGNNSGNRNNNNDNQRRRPN